MKEPSFASKITGTHVLLGVIGGMLAWIGTVLMMTMNKVDTTTENQHRQEIVFIQTVNGFEAKVDEVKETMIDSLGSFEDRMLAVFGQHKDTATSVYRDVLIPLTHQVSKNSQRISALEKKESERSQHDAKLLTFEETGLK